MNKYILVNKTNINILRGIYYLPLHVLDKHMTKKLSILMQNDINKKNNLFAYAMLICIFQEYIMYIYPFHVLLFVK